MQFRFFNIPVGDDGSLQDELNAFIKSKRVLEVMQQFSTNANGACWHFCVKYLVAQDKDTTFIKNKPKIDYKEILDDATFKIFSALRSIRKQIAVEMAVPAYAVFTDEELVNISKLSDITATNIITINGIGEKRMERFGNKVLELFHKLDNEENRVSN